MRVVTIPGFSLSGSSWQPVTELLSPNLDIVELDVPEVGDLPHTVSRLVARGGVGIYAGYSMGGRLALAAALDHPDAVKGLIVVSGTPGIADDGDRAQRHTTDDALADWIEAHGTEAFLDRWLAGPLFAAVDREAGSRHRLDDPTVIAGQLRRLGQGVQEPMWSRLHEIRVPVRFVVGSEDTGYTETARTAADAMQGDAEVIVVEGAGHALLVEAPDQVAEVIADAVDRVWR